MYRRLLYSKFMFRMKNYLSYYPFLYKIKNIIRKPQCINFEALEEAKVIRVEFQDKRFKPFVGLVKDKISGRDDLYEVYWPKYERFLKNNNIRYEFFNIHTSDWIDRAKKYDIIIWRPESIPSVLEEAKTKIYFLENYLNKFCYPSFKNVWHYEDKIGQYYLLRFYELPYVDGIVSHDYNELKNFVENTTYPIISKVTVGSSSSGIELIKDKDTAFRVLDKVFRGGYPTQYPYLKQKDYCIFQKFLPHEYDIRVIVVGNSYFGYRRRVPKGDFRASGMKLIEELNINNEEILFLVKKVKDLMGEETIRIAVDMLLSGSKYWISEISTFTKSDNCTQLLVNGIPGRYIFKNGHFIFEEGKFWIQELALAEVMRCWMKSMENRGI